MLFAVDVVSIQIVAATAVSLLFAVSLPLLCVFGSIVVYATARFDPRRCFASAAVAVSLSRFSVAANAASDQSFAAAVAVAAADCCLF